jgi:DNA segregation ATPase FtsK/SpoIIIE-like protein
MVTGSIAAMAYGEPRLTTDIDVVIVLSEDTISGIVAGFDATEFYVPPRDVMLIEGRRQLHGHFNLIRGASDEHRSDIRAMLQSLRGNLDRATPLAEIEALGLARGWASIGSEPKSAEAPGAQDRDPLFREAAQVCIQNQQGSTSLLQRKLKVGYGRAARIIDQLHLAGVLGPPDASKPRDVLAGVEDLDRICGPK